MFPTWSIHISTGSSGLRLCGSRTFQKRCSSSEALLWSFCTNFDAGLLAPSYLVHHTDSSKPHGHDCDLLVTILSQALRALRVLRIVRIARNNRGITVLVYSTAKSFPKAFGCYIIWASMSISFALLANRLFAGVREGTAISQHSGFSQFDGVSTSLLWLFRMSGTCTVPFRLTKRKISLSKNTAQWKCAPQV